MRASLRCLFIVILLSIGCNSVQSGNAVPAKSLVEGQVKLNREVVWDFQPCGDIHCNGKRLTLMRPLKEWVNILGPYNRAFKLGRDTYTWDKYGLVAVCRHHNDTVEQMNIVVYYLLDQDTNTIDGNPVAVKQLIKGFREESQARPNPFFQGGVMLDSVVLGRGMTIQQFNALSQKHKRAFEFNQDNLFGHLWQFYPQDCDAPFQWTVEVSEDFKDINQIFVYGRSNIMWELEQETKADNEQYKKELGK